MSDSHNQTPSRIEHPSEEFLLPGDPHHGENTTLRPEEAPKWLARLIEEVRAGGPTARIRNQVNRNVTEPDRSRQSAVQVALAGTGGVAGTGDDESLPADASVLLTHRSPLMRQHAGQIAFPGGRVEAEDVNPVDTALRESWEETGLDRLAVTPIGQLEELFVRNSTHPIHTVLTYWGRPAKVWPASPNETDHVFQAPLAELIDPANRLRLEWTKWCGPGFSFDGYLIWGFTAVVISEVIRAGGWEIPWQDAPAVPLPQALDDSRNAEPYLK